MPQPRKAKGRTRRRVKKNVPYGIAHVKTSFNNTIVTITDVSGNVIAWSLDADDTPEEAAASDNTLLVDFRDAGRPASREAGPPRDKNRSM